MYLNRSHYVWTVRDGEKPKVKVSGIKGLKNKDVRFVKERIIYWRKSNQIHKWFVEKIQDGVDNCATYYVDIEDLRNLLQDINSVLHNKKLSVDKLPTKTGFFFGSVDYDNYYWEDLERSKLELEKEIKAYEKHGSKWEYEYRASW